MPILHRVCAREGLKRSPVQEWYVQWVSLQVDWMAQFFPCASTSLFLDLVELATGVSIGNADVHALLMERVTDLAQT